MYVRIVYYQITTRVYYTVYSQSDHLIILQSNFNIYLIFWTVISIEITTNKNKIIKNIHLFCPKVDRFACFFFFRTHLRIKNLIYTIIG